MRYRNYTDEEITVKKNCTRCGKEKFLFEFYRSETSHEPICKICRGGTVSPPKPVKPIVVKPKPVALKEIKRPVHLYYKTTTPKGLYRKLPVVPGILTDKSVRCNCHRCHADISCDIHPGKGVFQTTCQNCRAPVLLRLVA